MKNKIKAEIERIKDSKSYWMDGRLDGLIECLKWAEELEKKILRLDDNADEKDSYLIIKKDAFKKAFEGEDLNKWLKV